MPSRNATGAEWVAINSPTIFPHASITSVSRKRSRNPRRCINFGSNSAGECQRSARCFLSGRPRHSAITVARREEFMRSDGIEECWRIRTDLLLHYSKLSIFSPHMTWQDIQFGAVFGDGTSRDRDTALAENLNNLIVAQRLIAILPLHQIEDSLFHAGITQRFAGSRLVARRKKVFHFENSLGRGHIFAGNCTTDRSLMYANRLRDFCHSHRLQIRWSMFKKIALPRNDLVRDVGNRLLALMD